MLIIGTLTGKTEELRSGIERERGKSDYKLFYFGSPHTQYGVGIAISEGFRDAIKEVERFYGRLMNLTIISADRTIHFSTGGWKGEKADGNRCHGERGSGRAMRVASV